MATKKSGKSQAPKAAKTVKTAKSAAPAAEAKPKLSLVKAAIAVLAETEEAMGANELVEAAKAKGITKVVVDRGGNPYTGRLAAIVESAVANGLSISDKPAKEAE